MNDDTLMTAVREPFTAVHMDTPVEQIVRRGRAVRARRRVLGLAGAAAVAAGATVAVTALLPAGHPAGAQLAAWTVTGQANGTIDVTIRELRDAARLQSTLRADGVPASVTFGSEPNPSCREYPGKWDPSKSGIQGTSGPPYISPSIPLPCRAAPECRSAASSPSSTASPGTRGYCTYPLAANEVAGV